MKEKNKHFCLKTVWNNIFSLPSAHVKAEPARLLGRPGRSLTLSSTPPVGGMVGAVSPAGATCGGC